MNFFFVGVWAHSGQEYLNCCDNSVPGLILQHIWCIHFSQPSHEICIMIKCIHIIIWPLTHLSYSGCIMLPSLAPQWIHLSLISATVYNNTCPVLIIIISYLVNIYMYVLRTLVIVTHEAFAYIATYTYLNSSTVYIQSPFLHFQYSFVLTFLHLTFLSPVTVLPSKPKKIITSTKIIYT